MPKLKIKLALLGQMPPDFDPRDLIRWKSKLFDIDPNIESFQLHGDAKGHDWEYTDQQLETYLREPRDCDFAIIFLTVKLQHNWYARRLSDNRILFTFFELDQILRYHGLPLRNLALRLIYAAVLIYKRFGNRIPLAHEKTNYAHDETRGCLFDMNASKIDAIHSCHEPQICEQCVAALKSEHVSNEVITATQDEIRRIRKPLLDRIIAFVRAHTIWSIVISLLAALFFNVVASIIATYITEAFRTAP